MADANGVDQTLHIYIRVSTVAQAEQGTSLESQRELGKKKADELGFKWIMWDEGGKSSHHEDIADRPVLSQLFAAIKEGVVKHLWVYDQSRLSRNPDGHFKFPHLWSPKFPQAGRFNYGVLAASRVSLAAASFSR